MAVDIEIRVRGRREFQRAADRIRQADRRNDLIRYVAEELAAPARGGISSAKRRGMAILPNSGGLANLVVGGSKYGVSTRTSGSTADVSITATSQTDIVSINRGTVRHPVYGNRQKWVTQSVNRGWFTDAMEGHVQEFHDAVWRGVDRLIEELERG